MMFRYIALLDRYFSNVDQLDLSYQDRILRIRKIPKKELEEFLLPPEPHRYFPETKLAFKNAILLSKGRYWIDYGFEVEDSRPASTEAFNTTGIEMKKLILGLRLFKEGFIRIAFYVAKAGSESSYIPLRLLYGNERAYVLDKSEFEKLKNFLKEFLEIAWKKKESKTSLGIALSRFTDGYERTKPEDKIIDYMIGLEALYLEGEATGEFGYKMAHKASTFLSNRKKRRKELFSKIKESYKLRSRIVHGGKYTLQIDDVWFAEDILRNSIRKFLQVPKPNWLDIAF